MKIIYIFILCITVIENYYSQLIVSSFPYECIFNQSAAFYNTILKDFNFTFDGNKNFSYQINETTRAEIELKPNYSDKTNSVSKYSNYDKQMMVISPNYFIIYNEITVTIKSTSGSITTSVDGNFNYHIFYMMFHENYKVNEDGTHLIDFDVELKIRNKDSIIILHSLNEIAEEIKNYLSSKVRELYIDSFKEQLKNRLNQGYQQIVSSFHPFTFQTASFLLEQTMQIGINQFMYFSKDVTKKKERILSYYSGNISDQLDYNASEDHKNEEFFISNKESKYTNKGMFFFNYKIIKELIDEIKKKNLSFQLTQDSNPFKDKIMNVDYLKNFLLKINYDYSPGTLFEIHSNITQVEYLTKNITQIQLTNSMIINNTKIMTFFSSLNITLRYDSEFSEINICISHLNEVEIKIEQCNYKIMELKKLREEIKKWIREIFTSSKICIFKENINLYKYLKIIEEIRPGENGIFVIGEPITQDYNI